MLQNPVIDYQKATLDTQELTQNTFSKVLILYTGGTIGMKVSENGYVPANNWLYGLLQSLSKFNCNMTEEFYKVKKYSNDNESTTYLDCPVLHTPVSIYGKSVHYCVLEYYPLLDSANMAMEDWTKIASDIEFNYDLFDAFLILHGTDTMAFTASALSFMFEHLGKTVILTGAQVPLSEWRTDAEENLLGALLLTGHFVIPEVCVFFNNKLYRGNRVSKVDALDFVAFDSPNMKPLASLGVNIQVNWRDVRRPNSFSRFRVSKIISKKIGILKLYPNISSSIVSSFFSSSLDGIVLETFGAGNAPSNRLDLLEIIRNACNNGTLVVNCTQCKRGMVSDVYETGKVLSTIGVLSGSDMTSECAFTKLSYLLGKDENLDHCKKLIAKNLRGELTVLPLPFQEKKPFEGFFLDALAESMGYCSPSEKLMIEKTILPQIVSSIISNGNHEALLTVCEQSGSNMFTLVNIQDYSGRSALHVCARIGNANIAKTLLGLGCNVHLRDWNGSTALGISCTFGNEEVSNILYQAGSNIHEDDHPSKFAFQKAAIYGDVQKVLLFIRCGFDVNTKLIHGQTALHLAYIYSQSELIRLKSDPQIFLANIRRTINRNQFKLLMKIFVGDDIGQLKSFVFKPSTNSISQSSCDNNGEPRRIHSIKSINTATENELIICRKSGQVDFFETTSNSYPSSILVSSCNIVNGYTSKDRWVVGSERGTLFLGKIGSDRHFDSFTIGKHLTNFGLSYDSSMICTGGIENPPAIYDLNNPTKKIFAAKNVPYDILNLRVPVKTGYVEFLNNSNFELVATNSCNIRVYDVRNSSLPSIDRKMSDLPISVMQKISESLILFSVNTGVVHAVDTRNFSKVLYSLKDAKGSIKSMSISKENSSYLSTVGVDRYLRIYDLKDQQLKSKSFLKLNLTSVLSF